MKKIKILMTMSLIVIMSGISTAQNLHNATVNGIVNIGNNDIASITDIVTGTLYKSSAHSQGILSANQSVQLEFNNSNIKVLHGSPEIILAFLEDSITSDTTDISDIENISEYIGVQHNDGLDYVYDKLVIDASNGADFSDFNLLINLIKQHTLSFILLEYPHANSVTTADLINNTTYLSILRNFNVGKRNRSRDCSIANSSIDNTNTCPSTLCVDRATGLLLYRIKRNR